MRPEFVAYILLARSFDFDGMRILAGLYASSVEGGVGHKGSLPLMLGRCWANLYSQSRQDIRYSVNAMQYYTVRNEHTLSVLNFCSDARLQRPFI